MSPPDGSSPFHAGEQALQERAGVRERLARIEGKIIRSFMPDQHRELFEQLPYLLVGSRDAAGRPWASILAGRPGFMRSPDPVTLDIAARPFTGDPLSANLAVGAAVGLLGIQLETRRRNRMNGTVIALDTTSFAVRVRESFGNCPQYIQARQPAFVAATAGPARSEGALLSPAATELIAAADTFFFIATAADGKVDVSHRGGRPGFVRLTRAGGRTVLTAPDYRGNFFFNTLGNIALEPLTGLLFIDFATGDLLQLTGAADVVWDAADLADFRGAERLLRFTVAEGRLLPTALPLRWSAPQPAPQLATIG